MSLYVVEREHLDFRRIGWSMRWELFQTYEPVDCTAKDGEWPAAITMQYETVEWGGLAVPVILGDLERRAWGWRPAYRRPRWMMRRGVAL